MNQLIAACILSLTALSMACGGAPQPVAQSAETRATPAGIKPMGEAKVGDRTLCPISHEEFTVTESSPKTEYKGKTYYFCCPGCDETFKKNPEAHLSGKSSS